MAQDFISRPRPRPPALCLQGRGQVLEDTLLVRTQRTGTMNLSLKIALCPIHTADATKLSSCVALASAVCTLYINSQLKLTTTADGFGDVNAAVGRDRVYNSAVNAIEVG